MKLRIHHATTEERYGYLCTYAKQLYNYVWELQKKTEKELNNIRCPEEVQRCYSKLICIKTLYVLVYKFCFCMQVNDVEQKTKSEKQDHWTSVKEDAKKYFDCIKQLFDDVNGGVDQQNDIILEEVECKMDLW